MRKDMYDRHIMNLLRKLTDYTEEGERAAGELYDIGSAMQDEYLLGVSCYYRAMYHMHDSLQLENVMRMCREAAEHAEKAKDYDTLCSAYILSGIVTDFHCNYPLAAAYYMDAGKISSRTRDPSLYEGIILTNIARVFMKVHAYQQAEAYNDRSIALLEKEKESPVLVKDLASMHAMAAILAIDADHDIEKAEKEYQITEKFRGREGWDETNEMDQMIVQIRIEEARGHEDEVMKLYHAYMHALSGRALIADYIDNVNNLLSYMIEKKHYDACEEIIHFLDTKLDTEVPGVLMQVYDRKIQYYRAIGDMQKVNETALAYYGVSAVKSHQEDSAAVVAIEGSLSGARLSQENIRLMKEAETDQLTGLPNRFALNSYGEQLFESSFREQKHLGVEIIDVDCFKEFNDTYGHVEGDRCLRAVADVVRTAVKEEPGMFAARYGGDEIIIMYDNLTNERMDEIMTEMSEAIQSLQMEHKNSKVADIVTISQGLYADVPQPENRLWDYTSGADNALYYVKNHHRGSWYRIDHTSYKNLSRGTAGWRRKICK